MKKEDVWNLFKMTGKIEYYLKYKEMVVKDMSIIGNNKSKRNNS